MKRKKKRSRLRVLPIILVIVAIIVLAASLLLYERYSPTKERADLYEYFGVTDAENVVVIRDFEQMDYQGRYVDGHVYLPYQIVHDTINDRFYVDLDELFLYVTDQEELIYNLATGGNTCLVRHYENGQMSEETVSFDSMPIKYIDGEFYIELDFVKERSPIEYAYYEDPSRVLLTTSFHEMKTLPVVKNTAIRVLGGIKSPILKDLFPGDTVYYLEEEENWVKVESMDGISGYVPKSHLGEESSVMLTCSYEEEEFTHNFFDGTVNMLWHQVTNTDVNDYIADTLAATKGVNVVSPTWFYLNDNTGALADLSSESYVSYCHDRGIQVWGLVSNLENSDADDDYVLSHYELRWNFINALVEKTVALGMDGINLDFEAISQDSGASYVQLVRELSLECGSHGIIFSVDNYVPTEYTLHYDRGEQALFADYVVIMGYDEHYNGSDEGSVASLPFVEGGIKETMEQGVPANQIILGMPFYTRIWEETPKTGASDMEMASDDYVPYESVTSRAAGMEEQNRIVASSGATVTWLDDLGQNFASWQEGEFIYKVWMEDSASLEQKLRVLTENALAGGAFWKSGLELPEIWDTVTAYLK